MSLPNAPSDLSSTQIQPEELEMIINNLVDRLISEIQSVVVWVGKGAHCDKLIRADFDLGPDSDDRKPRNLKTSPVLLHHRPTTPRAKFESYICEVYSTRRAYIFCFISSLLPSCYDS